MRDVDLASYAIGSLSILQILIIFAHHYHFRYSDLWLFSRYNSLLIFGSLFWGLACFSSGVSDPQRAISTSIPVEGFWTTSFSVLSLSCYVQMSLLRGMIIVGTWPASYKQALIQAGRIIPVLSTITIIVSASSLAFPYEGPSSVVPTIHRVVNALFSILGLLIMILDLFVGYLFFKTYMSTSAESKHSYITTLISISKWSMICACSLLFQTILSLFYFVTTNPWFYNAIKLVGCIGFLMLICMKISVHRIKQHAQNANYYIDGEEQPDEQSAMISSLGPKDELEELAS